MRRPSATILFVATWLLAAPLAAAPPPGKPGSTSTGAARQAKPTTKQLMELPLEPLAPRKPRPTPEPKKSTVYSTTDAPPAAHDGAPLGLNTNLSTTPTTTTYVLGIGGAAGIVGALGLFLYTGNQASQLSAKITAFNATGVGDRNALQSERRNLGTLDAATVAIGGAGAVALGTALYMYFFDSASSPDKFSWHVDMSPVGAYVSGAF